MTSYKQDDMVLSTQIHEGNTWLHFYLACYDRSQVPFFGKYFKRIKLVALMMSHLKNVTEIII